MTDARVRTDEENIGVRGYAVNDSSNIKYVGWSQGNMLVMFKGGALYKYLGVSRQRVVACALAASVGKYLNAKIKPNYEAVRIA